MNSNIITDDSVNAIREDLKNNSLESVLRKYDLTFSELFECCLSGKQIRRDKGNKYQKKNHLKYLQKRKHNTYCIRKSIKGEVLYFGFYETLDDAIRVRDRLISDGWKYDKLDSICEELNITRLRKNSL